MAESEVVEPTPRRTRAEIVGGHDDDLLTLDDVAEWFQCSRRSVVVLVTEGKLRSMKLGGLRRVKRAWVLQYLNNASR
jgi:excisionase family DNA binding protein